MAKYFGKAEDAGNAIVSAFQAGNLPQAMAPMFIKRKDAKPSNKWSWTNQFIALIHGCSDARAFGQWIEAKRCVKKGEKAKCYILAPCVANREKKDANGNIEKKTFIKGFRGVPVFDIAQTEGEAIPTGLDAETQEWFNNLPLRDVAESWGLSVNAEETKGTGANGWYVHKTQIAVGVKNLSTWCHELVHAADDKLGNLKERGQHWRSEIVAELGGAIILILLGNDVEADLGGCYEYVKRYAKDAGLDPISACTDLLKRTCDAVALIMETAENFNEELVGV